MSRYNQILKNLKEAISNPQLYSEEEIRFMKTQLRSLTESKQEVFNDFILYLQMTELDNKLFN